MKTRSYVRAAAPAAALSALLLVAACGSGDSNPDPTPSETTEEESGLSESDLEDALLTEDDVEGLDDVLTISGAATPEKLGDDIMLTITEAAVDRLETALADASA